jgi:hypothetical protein
MNELDTKINEIVGEVANGGGAIDGTIKIMALITTTDGERIKELEAWIVDCRDKLLYPLAFENSANGRLAEEFGASTVKILSA